MAEEPTVQLELIEREQVFLMNVLTVIVNGMERDGYGQREPERFRTATTLLLQLQNKTAARSVHKQEVISHETPSD